MRGGYMPFDGIVSKAVHEELQNKIVNGRITQIHQPTDTEIVFTVRKNRKNYRWLISIHPTYARFHLTEDTFQNPKEPPLFCMVLRKHLRGAIIQSLTQEGLERVVTLKVDAIDEIGDKSSRYLVIEIMGRHSNVLLLNKDKEYIIDCLKHVPPTQNRYRTLLPGSPYISPPAQKKLDPLTCTGEDLIKKLDFNQGKLHRQIIRHVAGFSPVIAQEIVFRAGLGDAEKYKEAFSVIQEKVITQKYQPTIYDNEKEDFHVIPLTLWQGQAKTFSSISQMLDQFYSGKAERDRVKQQSKDLHRLLTNELDKNKRKLEIHQKTLQKAKNADRYKQLGELLTANLHEVERGDSSITVINYYDPEQREIEIPLQPDQSPSENAQRFFRRYRRLNQSKKVVHREIVKAKHEMSYLHQVLQQLEHARENDILEIREELEREGYIRKQKRGKRKQPKPQPEQFISSDGTIIYVGRNNRQNEFIRQQLAHRRDIWLHTKDIPGSHVIIKSDRPSEKTIEEAALLAAYFSQARQSSQVPVDYTEVRHVKKPRGARPGFVIYENQKTLFVTPSEERVKKLQANQ